MKLFKGTVLREMFIKIDSFSNKFVSSYLFFLIEMFIIVFLQLGCNLIKRYKLSFTMCFKNTWFCYFFCIAVTCTCLLLLFDSLCSLILIQFWRLSFTFSFDARVCHVFCCWTVCHSIAPM